tara:strand:+ start:3032 stop:3610 length:579 start_codon:yes stop_codon:yes gene_type:complete
MTKSDKKEQENKLSNNDESKIPDEEENNELKKPSMEEQLKTTQEKLLRTMAEMENQRRRFEKEIEEAFEFGGFNFAKESLALLDNIDRAISSFKNDEKLKNNNDLNKIIEGIEIVKKDLASNFKKNGIDEIECMNKKFDPNYHQAMLELDSSDKEPGVVIQEMQKGYMMKGRLLRPSLVGVSKKKQENVEKK